jgi:ribonuclease P protein component
MLDRAHRLTGSQAFSTALRQGHRAGTSTLVVHLAGPSDDPAGPPRVGLVVSRGVGRAVTRNQVKRRLRHLVRDRIGSLPDGSVLVVRALPPAATVGSAELAADLDRALARSLRRLTERGGHR